MSNDEKYPWEVFKQHARDILSELRADAILRQHDPVVTLANYLQSFHDQGLKDARRWIPLSERLPANGQKVALLMAEPFNDQVYTAQLCGNKFYNICDEDGEEPEEIEGYQYWMPLPPAPEEK